MGSPEEPQMSRDLIGYPLKEAKATLANQGCAPMVVQETRPPKSAPQHGLARVVRQRLSPEGKWELMAARFREL